MQRKNLKIALVLTLSMSILSLNFTSIDNNMDYATGVEVSKNFDQSEMHVQTKATPVLILAVFTVAAVAQRVAKNYEPKDLDPDRTVNGDEMEMIMISSLD